MEKENNKEEIQSRREFFKKATRKTLPIVALIAAVKLPFFAKSATNHSTGCYYGCINSCYSCIGTCLGTCTSCIGGCFSCIGTCVGTCTGTCMGSCMGWAYYY